MFRNKDAIVHTSQAASALYKIVEIAKLLRLTQAQIDDMVKTDITSMICASCSFEVEKEIVTYTQGLRDGLVYGLLKDHCEFVYFIEDKRYTLEQLAELPPGSRGGGINGYQWKDSEFDFTEFKPEIQL